MIGQTKLTNQLSTINLPRCFILKGDKGSGKKTFITEVLSDKFENVIFCGKSVDDVRDTIDLSIKNAGNKTLYVFADADSMSMNARNALLKVLEEPPQDAYFVLTLENEDNTLQTIRSRATMFVMDCYTNDELTTYMFEKYGSVNNKLIQICAVPGEIDLLYNIIDDFYAYVVKVVNNVDLVQGANSFKIGDKINLSNDDNKYDLSLFWRCFIAECYSRVIDINYSTQERLKYAVGIRVTSDHLKDLRKAGINKQFLFDTWLLQLREAWFNYAEDN